VSSAIAYSIQKYHIAMTHNIALNFLGITLGNHFAKPLDFSNILDIDLPELIAFHKYEAHSNQPLNIEYKSTIGFIIYFPPHINHHLANSFVIKIQSTVNKAAPIHASKGFIALIFQSSDQSTQVSFINITDHTTGSKYIKLFLKFSKKPSSEFTANQATTIIGNLSNSHFTNSGDLFANIFHLLNHFFASSIES